MRSRAYSLKFILILFSHPRRCLEEVLYYLTETLYVPLLSL